MIGSSPGYRPLPIFIAFAAAYFLSALVRAITATLAPTLTHELRLSSGELGLLSAAYFLGFVLLQLPMGKWLDRVGPRRVESSFLIAAMLGCLAFSLAESFSALLAARVLCGAGFAACLMAPLTGYRRWYSPTMQLRANSWMLMTGSLGMLAATLPVQWLVPVIGWRWLFLGLAVLILLSVSMILRHVPHWSLEVPMGDSAGGYAAVWRHPYFRALVPVGFFSYGGMVAVQTLWAGPWLSTVIGADPLAAASGLFMINLCMLGTFWAWGAATPWLAARGWKSNRLMVWGIPFSSVILLANVLLGQSGGWWGIALFCMACSFVTLSQPAIGLVFPPQLAGRALSAFNLVLFCGVFVVQWGVGVLVDMFRHAGLSAASAYQWAFTVLLFCKLASYAWLRYANKDN